MDELQNAWDERFGITVAVGTGVSTTIPEAPVVRYDNDQLSSEPLADTVAKAKAYGVDYGVLDTGTPSERAAFVAALNRASSADWHLHYGNKLLSEATSQKSTVNFTYVLPGALFGALAGGIAGFGAVTGAMALHVPERVAVGIGAVVAGACLIGGSVLTGNYFAKSTDDHIASLQKDIASHTQERDAAVADAREINASR